MGALSWLALGQERVLVWWVSPKLIDSQRHSMELLCIMKVLGFIIAATIFEAVGDIVMRIRAAIARMIQR